MKAYLAFIVGTLWVVFIYWLGGGSFERGSELAAVVTIAPLLGVIFFNLVKLAEGR